MSSINDKLISYGNLATFHSNLLNDSSVSDKATWSSSKIASELALVGFDVQIVQELPASGDPHTIYFILKSDSSIGDVYDEWMYINNSWEMVGNTQIDLSDYAKISDVDASLALKQNLLSAGQNIAIDASNNISALGYVWDASYGSTATIYRQDQEEGGALVANRAVGLGAFAEGILTDASCNYGAHAEGIETTATGDGAHAEGAYRTLASGNYSHAEGGATTASGSGAHSEGQQTVASGSYSHAEGNQSVASGKSAHAEGGKLKNQNPTTATGNLSHAEGGSTSAIGQSSHTEGELTEAKNGCEHAQGECNVSHKNSDTYGDAGNTIDSIGIGTVVNYVPQRKNATEVMQNGDYYLLGVGGYQGTDTKVQNASIMTVQEVINGKADAADLSSYATLAYVDASLTLKADKSYVDASLALKADVYEVATTADIEALFASPAPTAPADDEIWYTTESGNLWEPLYVYDYERNRKSSLLLVNDGNTTIISNTYVNGHGVIKYSEPITQILLSWGYSSYQEEGWLEPDKLDTDVTSVTLPNSIESVEKMFIWSAPQLEAIYYNGTVAECEEITWSSAVSCYSNMTEITCLDGESSLPECDPYGGGY